MLSASGQEVNQLAIAAKTDEAKLEDLIHQNTRFILSCASKATGRYITRSDDEWSVSLIAFHEAVRSYAPEKGDFLSFAALVIRRRLIDQANRSSHLGNEIPIDFSGGHAQTAEELSPVELEARRQSAERAIHAAETATAIRDEIAALSQALSAYGISFPDLARHSPKAKKTKAACAVLVRTLLEQEPLLRQLRRTSSLPVNSLREKTNIPLNILNKHRKYIIAAVEILHGDYPQLAEYLRYIREGGEDA